MKRILGLDLGTNSIGWALVEINHTNNTVKILGLGSRILPMDAGEVSDFENSGKIKSAAAQRTEKRGARRLNERYLLRRDRLHLVLDLLGSLPKHYKLEIDFTNSNGEKNGKFKKNTEPKLAYLPKQNNKKAEFLFMDSYEEMISDIGCEHIKNNKGSRIPYDWTLYYLRQKALSQKISLEELAWVLLSYNQKRGYEKTEVEDKSIKEGEQIEELDLRVNKVLPKKDNKGQQFYEIHLDGNDNFIYKEYSDVQLTFKNDLKEIIKISKVDDQGNTDKNKTEFIVIDIYQLEITKVQYQNEAGKHIYTLTYQTGWEEIKRSNNYTFRYKNALNKPYNYIAETLYDNNGNIKTQQGKDRKLREPELTDNSSDWTLLKKQTEKEALSFNVKKGYISDDGNVKEYISPKIYDVLKNDAIRGKQTKIIGGLFQVVDRNFYREELNQIISTQKQFHKSLGDAKTFEQCVKILYPKNKSHQYNLLKNKNAIQHLLVEDILLYQRPLKSKKSEISNCKYEIQYWKDIIDKRGKRVKEIDISTGEIKPKKEPIFIKVASASHPYFQEFRIWDKLHNLRLIQLEKEVNGKVLTNQDITSKYFIGRKEYQELFEELNKRKSLNQDQFLAYCKRKFKIDYNKRNSNYTWNFSEDDEIKGNETRVSFVTRFKRCGFTDYNSFLTQEKERELWHYLYSVSFKERTANDNKSAITFFNNYFKGFAIDEEIKEKIINDFANYPKFASRYCAYSEKALKKLIPLLQKGNIEKKYAWENEDWYVKWKESNEIRKNEILNRIAKIDFSNDDIHWDKYTDVTAPIPFPKGLFNTFKTFREIEDFTNLNLTQASYLVYGRHSELAQAKYWTSPEDIRKQLHQELKQHSLNNPIAEKVLLEMMQIVADIWDYYGEKKESSDTPEKLFDRIHLEVGRELNKSAKEKEAESKRMSVNRSQNKRIRQILEEFLSNSEYNANPKNHDHFERLKIAEEGAEHRNNLDKEFFNDKPYSKKDIEEILKKPYISKQDFEKYKLWLEQGYKSPYTNLMIKLTDLFDGNKYNIDHVFPQASVTNNSLSNKIVCEKEVNQLKSDQTGRDFVNNPKQREVYCTAHNRTVLIINDEAYVKTVKEQFSGTKRYILLSKDIPKGFTNSQLNNTRHISRKAMELLSHIVREPGEVEFRSKNVLPVTGRVTTELKRTWKLDQVWRELVAPRFIRLNELTQSNLFGDWQVSKNGQKYFDCNLNETIRNKDDSYDIKRIDHRHHALDALIVALCTEEHVNYINNINANAKSENYGKQKQIEKYRQTLKRKIMWSKPKKENPKENDWYYMLPGETRLINADNSRRESVLEKSYLYKEFEPFGQDYKKMILTALQNTIVTFKQNLRVINKTVNRYNNTPNKNKFAIQNTDNGQQQNWSIRRSLGEETFRGKTHLGETENKQLHKCLKLIYNSPDLIVDKKLQLSIAQRIEKVVNFPEFETLIKKEFPNNIIELKVYKITVRKSLVYNVRDNVFNSDRIKSISDNVGHTKTILLNHLKQFDTIELPIEKAINYFDALIEKQELEAIVNNEENNIQSIDDLITYLRENNYKYKNTDYSKLNIFIDKVSERDFRNDKLFKEKIKEHPEIAFTPEAIEEMNKFENIKKLNNGKSHKPIRKVTTSTGFSKQRAVSNNLGSVKSRQFVVNDAGTNIYLAVYEIENKSNISSKNPIRIFKEISLFDLIDYQKSTNTNDLPIEERTFSSDGEQYNLLFTLSQNDIVKINNENEQIIYAFNRFSGNAIYFRPINHSTEIFKNEVDLKAINPKTGKNPGSLVNETASFNGEPIKNICVKLNVNRLGNILKA